jgi:hypothetical protein
MTAQARRLPRTLKKKLEATLTSLTPREAGRLFLLYYHEARAKNFPPGRDYPPVKELEDAWARRLEAAEKRGIEERNVEAARFNGYWYLASLVASANMFAESDLWRIIFACYTARREVEALLYQDAVSELARTAIKDLVGDMPRPVSRADYDRMVAWAKTDALDTLETVAEGEAYDWESDQNFSYHEVPPDFWETHKDNLDELLKKLPKEADLSEESRAIWKKRDLAAELKELATTVSPLQEALAENSDAVRFLYAWGDFDRLLKEVFDDDPARLAYWVAQGSYTDPADEAAVKAKQAELEAQMADMLKAGTLTGGPAFALPGLWSPVLICEGKIPAWVALRYLWDDWVRDRGVYKYDMPSIFDERAPNGSWSLYDAAGDVVDDRLTDLVGDFLKECRSRPWGEGLTKKIDRRALAAWLTAVDNPLTQIDAPDLGLVDWEAFRSREGNEGDYWEPKLAATVGSLAKALGEEDFWRVGMIEESFYPTARAHDQQTHLHNVIARLHSLRVSHRAFTYQEKPKPGQLSLQELLGMEFYTPLEEAVKRLGDAQGQVDTFKRVFGILSDKYYDGLPILAEEYRERLELAESLLTSAGEELAEWLDRLSRWPWSVDTTTLKPVTPEVDEDQVREKNRIIEGFAMLGFTGDKSFMDLGEDDQKPKTPPTSPKAKRGAK